MIKLRSILVALACAALAGAALAQTSNGTIAGTVAIPPRKRGEGYGHDHRRAYRL